MTKKKTEKKSKKTTQPADETQATAIVQPGDAPLTDEETIRGDVEIDAEATARIVDVNMPHAAVPNEEEPAAAEAEGEPVADEAVEELAADDKDLITEAVTALYSEAEGDEETFVAEEGYGEMPDLPGAEEPAAAEVPEPPLGKVEDLEFGKPREEDEEPEAIPSEIEDETAFIEEMPDAAEFQTPAELKAALECLFFTTSHPLSLVKLRNIVGKMDMKTLRGIVLQLQAEYVARGSGIQIIESAEGFQMCTRPDYANVILRLHRQRKKNPLTLTALETLAIIAYKQPITRAEIEMIRGVESSGVVRNLLDMGMLRVVGRKEVIGRPQLYGTTNLFLTTFGLKSINDLPAIQDLRRRYATNAAPLEQVVQPPADAVALDEPDTPSDSSVDAAAPAEEAVAADPVVETEVVEDSATPIDEVEPVTDSVEPETETGGVDEADNEPESGDSHE